MRRVGPAVLVLVATIVAAPPALSQTPAAPPAPASPAAPVVPEAPSVPAAPGTLSFDDFLAGVRVEALERGISAATIDRAFTNLTPEPAVVRSDRTQPDQVQSLETYLAQRLTSQTTATAQRMFSQHARVLADVEKAYGVPGPVMTAIWGLESAFGRFTGTHPTIRALATLAWDNRRPLFRTELFAALEMIDRGVPIERMKGSWAGAMGQPQFLPSSFLEHAVDFDADGVADIWSSLPDVLGSMANYLKNAGWVQGERWGREVAVSNAVLAIVDREVPLRAEGCRAVRAMTEPRPLAEWTRLGVTLPGGAALPSADMQASLVRGASRYFLVYRNYEALLDYNCSHPYALSVALLADRIVGR